MVILAIILLFVGGHSIWEGLQRGDTLEIMFGGACLALLGALAWFSNRRERKLEAQFSGMLEEAKVVNPSALLDITVRAGKGKRLTVFPDRIVYGGMTIAADEVEGLTVMNNSLSVNGSESATRMIWISGAGKSMAIDCSASSAKTWHRMTFDTAFQAIYSVVGGPMIKAMVNKLERGEAVALGKRVDVTEEGITVKPRRFEFWTRDWKIEWRDVWVEMHRGQINIRDTSHNNMFIAAVKVGTTENALPVFQMIDRLAGGNERLRRGERVMPISDEKRWRRGSAQSRQAGTAGE